MADVGLEIVESDPAAPEAAALIAALDAELHRRYTGIEIHSIHASEFGGAGGVFLLGRAGGKAVACGAIRPMGNGVCELKRMYLDPAHRRRGYARAVLRALEGAALARGWRTVRLETGIHQPEAMALYESEGYRAIPQYADYGSDPRSRYYEKLL